MRSILRKRMKRSLADVSPTHPKLLLLRQIAQIIVATSHHGRPGLIESFRCVSRAGTRRHDLLHHGYEALLIVLAEVGQGFQMGRSC